MGTYRRKISAFLASSIFIILSFSLSGYDFSSSANSASPFSASVSQNSNIPLPVDDAFQLTINPEKNKKLVEAHWVIAPNYHLYRSRVHFKIMPGSGYGLGKVILPKGTPQHNNVLGNYQVYDHSLWVELPLTKLQNNSHELSLHVHYQGCKELTFCYPAVNKLVKINLNTGKQSISNYTPPQASMPQSQQDHYSTLFAGDNILWILLSFIGFGLLLSFTPCVLPMIPILSSIILGQKKASPARSFVLSVIYVLSASITFAIAGYLTALAGHSVQAALQNEWVIIGVALIFVILALSLFGLFEIKMPAKLQNKIHGLSGKQTGGTYIGTIIMGVLSSLVVSPCISAPLVGALIYISTTGNALLGAAALFCLGIGMGIPLIIIGTLEGKFFIKAGSWMKIIKIAFGCLMLLMAVWMLSRVWLIRMNTQKPDGFVVVHNMVQLKKELNIARTAQKPALIDFYASWCVACKELEYNTFQNKQVKIALKNYVLIRADVTANNQNTKSMEKHFSVYAPPTVVFTDKNGHIIKSATIYGYVPPKQFMKRLMPSS